MNQAELFAPEPAPQKLEPSYGMPPGVRVRWERAMRPDVVEEVMVIAGARPDEWLTWSAFRTVIEKYQIGFCFGQVLTRLVRAGRLEVRKVYCGRGIGAEQPGSPNYQGFGHEYQLAVK